MKLFDFDTDAARDQFAAQGWAHLPAAVTPEFLARVREQIGETLDAAPDLIGGNRANKEQFRLDLEDLPSAQQEIFAAFGAMTGRNPDTLTLSERHVNAYREDADPDPVPHKDRRASQVTIGIAVDVPAGSHLVLYPSDDRTENAEESAAAHYQSLAPERRPEAVLAEAEPVELFDRPGDVVVFSGSTTWHHRRQAAGTVNLFFKLNDFGDDPLGEDARHGAVTTQSS